MNRRKTEVMWVNVKLQQKRKKEDIYGRIENISAKKILYTQLWMQPG